MYEFVETIFLVISTVSLIVIAGIQLAKYRFNKVVFSMSDRWDEHKIDDFYNYINSKIDFNLESLSDEHLALVDEDPELRISINAVLNFFEEVGYAYNKRLIDRKYAENSFSDPIISCYNRYGRILEDARIQCNDESLGAELEKMYRIMVKKRTEKQRKSEVPVYG